MDEPTTATPQPGEIIAGKYRVDRVIGRGGMGIVLAAENVDLGQKVAIKLLYEDALQNDEAIARFTREARIAARMKSEHVARVLDIVRTAAGAPCMVMELLEGEDVERALARRERIPIDEAIELLLQASEAIAEAHALGVVHRDLKPSNLFVARKVDGSPIVKVLDFGVSKILGDVSRSQAALTRTNGAMGTPLYMPPEQMSSAKHVDQRADIWALGAILFEMVTGTAPFHGATIPEVCSKILQEEAPSSRSFVADLPAALDAIFARCLAKDPAKRFASVADLAVALGELAPKTQPLVERIARVAGGAAFPAPMHQGSTSPSVYARTEAPWTGGTPRPTTSLRHVLLGLGAALVLAGGLFTLFGIRARGNAAASATVRASADVAPAATSSAQSPVVEVAASSAAAITAAPTSTATPTASASAISTPSTTPSASATAPERHVPVRRVDRRPHPSAASDPFGTPQ